MSLAIVTTLLTAPLTDYFLTVNCFYIANLLGICKFPASIPMGIPTSLCAMPMMNKESSWTYLMTKITTLWGTFRALCFCLCHLLLLLLWLLLPSLTMFSGEPCRHMRPQRPFARCQWLKGSSWTYLMTTYIHHVSGAPFKHFYLVDFQITPVDTFSSWVFYQHFPRTWHIQSHSTWWRWWETEGSELQWRQASVFWATIRELCHCLFFSFPIPLRSLFLMVPSLIFRQEFSRLWVYLLPFCLRVTDLVAMMRFLSCWDTSLVEVHW